MKTFPILNSGGESVPWDAVEAHREQAEKNHFQTLEQLAGRGGLSWKELYFTLTNSPVQRLKYEQVDYRRLVLDLLKRKPTVGG